jgi:23S rRNA (cytidine1920-2'-O)/16S rRNA (cytidine1409-2'-O)-methyltransferase
MEERLDKIVMQRELFPSRAKAEKTIEEFGLTVDGKLCQKPGKKFPLDCTILLPQVNSDWISESALKLEYASSVFNLDFQDKLVLDINVDKGGFCEFLLKSNVEKIICVDAEKTLDEDLMGNAKITYLPNFMARELTRIEVPNQVDFCTINVHFKSLSHAIPFVHPFVKSGGQLIAILKPELEKNLKDLKKARSLERKGLFQEAIDKIKDMASKSNFKFIEYVDSIQLGENKLKEYVLLFEKR